MVRCSLTCYLLRILLSKTGPRGLRKLLSRRRPLFLLQCESEESGVAFTHPLTCLRRGLLRNQIVELTVSFQSWQGVNHQLSRFLLLQISTSLPVDTVVIGRIDAYNVFSRIPSTGIVIDSLRPYHSLPKVCNTLLPADCVRLAAIKQYAVEQIPNLSSRMRVFLNTPRILYTGDVISVDARDPLADQTHRHYFKVFCDDSPCVADVTTTIYQVASVNDHLPYAARAKTPAIPPSMSALVERMRNVCLAHEAVDEKPLVFLLSGASGSGKRLLSSHLAVQTHRNLVEFSCFDLWSENVAQSETKLRSAFEKGKSCQPAIVHLTSVDVLGKDSTTNTIDSRILSTIRSLLAETSQLVVIFSCNSDQVQQLSSSFRSIALYNFIIESLDEGDRRRFFYSSLPPDLAQHAARRTAGFVIAELADLLKDVDFLLHTEAADGVKVSHIERAIDKRNSSFADAIGAPKIPSVSWDDVGGFEDTKQLITESIDSVLHGGAVRRSGIMLFGPPGCGKTLIAKAVATEFKTAFLSVKGPELLNKYVGQSEENVRKVFERARQSSPCIIFFDELDSLVPNRGRSGDSGGVMDRIVSQLIAELDSLHNTPHVKVFVMAATNRADLIDPALLTSGRFDKVVHVAPGADVESKAKILKAVSRKVNLAADVDLREVAAQCDGQMSGAELYSIVSSAAMESIREQIALIEMGRGMAPGIGSVTRSHLQSALSKIRKTEA